MSAARHFPGPQRHGPPQLYVFAVRQRVVIAAHVLNARRHDAQYLVGRSGQGQRTADDVRVAAHAALPETIAQDDGLSGAFQFVARLKGAAQKRSEAQGFEEPGGDSHGLETLGLVADGEVEILAEVESNFRENLVADAEIQEVSRGHREVVPLGPDAEDADQAIRLRIGQRLEQDAIDHAENGAVAADGKRQNEHRNRRETGVLTQGAKSVMKVLPQIVHRRLQLSLDERRSGMVREIWAVKIEHAGDHAGAHAGNREAPYRTAQSGVGV